MGVAVTQGALKMGARVTLVHGPLAVPLPKHRHLQCLAVRNAADMYRAVLREAPKADLLVMAAAVADFTPVAQAQHKIKKGKRKELILRLKPTKDILAAVGQMKKRPLIVGFAAETEKVIKEARRKLFAKNCTVICANDVTERGSGFEANTNRVTLVYRDGRVEKWRRMSKRRVAERLLRRVVGMLHAGGDEP